MNLPKVYVTFEGNIPKRGLHGGRARKWVTSEFYLRRTPPPANGTMRLGREVTKLRVVSYKDLYDNGQANVTGSLRGFKCHATSITGYKATPTFVDVSMPDLLARLSRALFGFDLFLAMTHHAQ
ncbi:hypothetical protein EVAR_56601_1 [Eumeta japonica]|uniref:Uncharacterized protein n=1 Tax=Eumeta variegata TaxID=151549 RepID=A0A4C1Z2D1_EUMVA|nr:hypothetical protein EVAR_56601_1 [Eumeta japonica]